MSKKKEEEGADDTIKAPSASGTSKTLTTADAIPDVPDKLAGEDGDDEEDDIMYGHKDDVVWTDKSYADKEAEAVTEDDTNAVR